MDGNDILKFLSEHRKELLYDIQFKHCGPCGGPKMYEVYRSPVAAELGEMLKAYEASK